jgi:hypothetical protein
MGIVGLSLLWVIVRKNKARAKIMWLGASVYLLANSYELYASFTWHQIICPGAVTTTVRVEHVEGYYASGFSERDAKFILSLGYKFVEMDNKKNPGSYVRFNKETDGSVSMINVQARQSRYAEYYEEDNTYRPEAFGNSLTIRSIETGELLGQQRRYYFLGGRLYNFFKKSMGWTSSNPIKVCPIIYTESLARTVIPPL